MGRWLFFVLIIFAPISWAQNPTSETAQRWLQRMVEASKSVSYQGHSVLLSGGELTSLSVFHASVNGEVWERIVHMNGEPAEIIRKGSDVVCLHKDRAMQLSPVGPLMALKNGFAGADAFYTFEVVAEDRVAGRVALRIDVQPKDQHRYGYSLWMDQASGILLKSQTNGDGLTPLEVFEFVQLQVGQPIAAESFQPSADVTRKTALIPPSNADAQAQATAPFDLKWLPEGFKPVKSVMQPKEGAPFAAQVFSDGLAAFTVFFDQANAGEGIRFKGATVAVNQASDQGSITVVGEIPLATAQKVAQSANILASHP